MNPTKETFEVVLPAAGMSDAELGSTVAAIATNAPTSTVYTQNPPVAATVDTVIVLGKTWTKAEGDVAADEAKLETDKQIRDDSRTALTQKLQLLRSQVQDAAPTAAAARAVGVPTRDGKALPAPLLDPSGGTVTFSRRGGEPATSNARRHIEFASPCQMTLTDPVASGTGRRSHTRRPISSSTPYRRSIA